VNISVDLSPIYHFLTLPADVMLLTMLINIGWIPIVWVFLWGAWEIWKEYIGDQWFEAQKYVLLAIDIPRGNTQSLKAVENIFVYLAGAHGSKNLIETYWDGQFILPFSFEIVSIDGYTQFLVRTPAAFRNLVESAIYSQYPDAEISDVDDYAVGHPTKYPDPEYDVWGTEFVQTAPNAYPIKTYGEFLASDGTKPEEQFKDPMASLMDLCSSLRKGEQLWYQIIIQPIDFSWTKTSDAEIKKILGDKTAAKENFVDVLVGLLMTVISSIGDIFYKVESKKEEKKDELLKMMNLRPKEKKQVEAIQVKASKIGFNTKIRFVYISKKDTMVKPKVVNGFNGFIKQFVEQDLNGLKPNPLTVTSAAYFFKDRRINTRKGKIVRNYINRGFTSGGTPGIMNVEELATMWHFPLESVVKAPMIQKAPGRKSEPPMSLPMFENAVDNDFFTEKVSSENIFAEIDESLRPSTPLIAPQGENKEVRKGGVVDISDFGAGDIFQEPEVRKPIEKPVEQPTEKRGSPPSNLPFA